MKRMFTAALTLAALAATPATQDEELGTKLREFVDTINKVPS